MKFRKLGDTDIDVSVICLGSMTWGEQNSQQQAFEQLDYAMSQGVNFIDTAELYAIPPCAETYGKTEEFIGAWLKARGNRDHIVLASKIAGSGEWISHIRNGESTFDQKNIVAALDASLKRLNTDYLDLYQLHWPERKTNFFGELGYQPVEEDSFTAFAETLEALDEQVKAGKIRHFGLSNETPWGVMQFLKEAERLGLPKPVSIQNPYSLLNRTYEVGLSEISCRENIGLLAYSPLGFGVLSGKYLDDSAPADARIKLYPDYTRYSNREAIVATQLYVSLAQEHGLDTAQMSLAYVNTRLFLTSTIIGATTMQQLEMNIASIDLELSDEVLQSIEAIHVQHPNPSP